MWIKSDSLVEEVESLLSKEELMGHTKMISGWERLSGSREEALAFDYIQEFLEKLGLKVKRYSHDAFISLPLKGRISFDGLQFRANPPSMSGSTTEKGISAHLKYIGSDDLSHFENSLNRLIVVLDGMPMPAKTLPLLKSGCLGAVFIQQADLVSEGILSPVWGSPSSSDSHKIPDLPVVSVNRETGEALKVSLTKSPDMALNLFTKMDTGWRKIPAMTAEIETTKDNSDYVLFSGHVDSWYYGAMDNGSANAAMLEVARVISSRRHLLKRNLRLAFWSGHSHGRYAGSAWYADEFWNDLKQNCVIHINVDSLGARNAQVLSQAHIMEETKTVAAQYIGKYTSQQLEGVRIGRAGDQSFWGHGIPSMFMTLSEQFPESSQGTSFSAIIGGSKKTGGLGWWWHTEADTFDKIDSENLLRDTKIYAAVVTRFCCDDIIPLSPLNAVNEMKNHMRFWQDESGDRFDLGGTIHRLEILAEKIRDFVDASEICPQTEKNKILVNTTIKELERTLVPINYVSCDRFFQDPALNQPPIPSLAILKNLNNISEKNRVCEIVIEAKRRRNRIDDSLICATSFVETAIQQLPD